MERIEFEVDGMTCGGCSARVQRALDALGVAAQVTRNPGRVVVEATAEVDAEEVQRAIVAAGYPARRLASAA